MSLAERSIWDKSSIRHLFLIALAFGITVLAGLQMRGSRSEAPVNSVEDRFHLDDGHVVARDPVSPCGVTAVAVASYLLDSPVKLSEVREVLVPRPTGENSMAELEHALDQLGFFSCGVHVADRDLSHVRIPATLYIEPQHFIVVQVDDTETAAVFDPPRNPINAPSRSILGWEGECLLVAKTPDTLEETLSLLNAE